MTPFTPKTFTIPAIEGISEKTIAGHIKLYEGYVKHANLVLEKMEEMAKDSEKNAYALGELQRRFAFEFDGMRNHEYYFMLLEDGAKPLDAESALAKAIAETWGSVDAFMTRFKAIAMTRGIGWAILLYDKHTDRLLTQWVDEQHLGHLVGLMPILPLDMWEHAYLLDHIPSEKMKYAEAYLAAINWETANEWFENIRM
jgi:superoxide dismutase, Fe-Mn family